MLLIEMHSRDDTKFLQIITSRIVSKLSLLPNKEAIKIECIELDGFGDLVTITGMSFW